MKDVVFLKEDKRDDKLWENNPHLAFALGIPLYIAAMIGIAFLLYMCGIKNEWAISLVSFFFPMGVFVAIMLYKNEYSNISKSIGFVKRNNILYAIKLGYADTPFSTVINAPSGSLTQATTLKHNFEVAKGVQDSEREIRERRTHEEAYILALDEFLKQIQAHPKKYYRKKKKGETKFHGSFNVKGAIGFLILEEPRIERETKGYLWISYADRHGERTTIKFRNAYGKLKEEIEMQNI